MTKNGRPPLDDRLNAFCKDSDAYLEGAVEGPLAGLSFAAKDIFDVAGHVTGGGNPDWKAAQAPAGRTAWAVKVLNEAGAAMIGKTITDEITRGIFGENAHYGTPVNPRAPGRVPGGSSSGSASAVAGGLADFALGSDTGGSVRVPASFCGLYGLRPTHGRISLEGVLPQSASFDTVGWFARDIEIFVRAGAVLLQSDMAAERPRRLVIAEDAFEIADRAVAEALGPIAEMAASLIGGSDTERLSLTGLADWRAHQWRLQNREAWDTVRDWIDRENPRFAFDVSERYVSAAAITDAETEASRAVQADAAGRMEAMLDGGTVVCLPTTASPAPPVRERHSTRNELRPRNSALTCIAGFSGLPQISLPLAEAEGLPVGFSLIGARGADEMLIAFAREMENAAKGQGRGAA